MTSTTDLLRRDAVAGGLFLSDPRDFDRWAAQYTWVCGPGNGFAGGFVSDKTDPTAVFAAVDKFGDISTSSFTAGTYKTLVDVSGGGFLYQVIGPEAGVNTSSAIRLTIDSAVYEIALSSLKANFRQSIGARKYVRNDTISGNAVESFFPETFNYELSTGFVDGHIETANAYSSIASFTEMANQRQILKYVDGLKVEVKIGSIASMNTAKNSCGVIYRPVP